MDDLSDLLINFGICCFLDKNVTDNIGLHIYQYLLNHCVDSKNLITITNNLDI